MSLGQPTPIADITKGLRALWDADSAKSRAALMNLVIYAEDGTSLEEMAEDAAAIGKEQACRALIIRSKPCIAGEAPAKAWITAHCNVGGKGSGLICCEQVAFELCAETTDQLRNLVFAHLDSDLPLVFWWRGELSESFEPQLYSRFERLLIDSDSWQDGCAGINRAHDAAESDRSHFVLHDLAWSRTHVIRLAIADCFEDPHAAAALANVQSLKIAHATGHAQSARILAAWFASRLQWDEQQARSTITIEEAGEAAISSVSIEAGNSRFSITSEATSNTVRTHSSLTGREHQQVLPAGAASNAEVVRDLLARGGKNELYLQCSEHLVD